MTQYHFNAFRWVRRLAGAIDRVLAYETSWDNALQNRRYEESAMGLANRIPEVTREERIKERIYEYWHLEIALRTGRLTEYKNSLPNLLSYVEEVIRQHPTIKSCLGSEGDFDGIKVYSPSSRFSMSTKQIVEGVLSYAVDCGAFEAASSLEERIRLGEERNLVGSQITLFHGLRVEGSHELPNGMIVTSLEDVEDQVDLVHIENLLLGQRLMRVSLSSVGVVRWNYKWGPSIAAMDDDELKFTELPEDLNKDARLAVTALGLVCDAPITIIESIDDNFDRRIARALCYRNRYTTLNNLKTRLSLGISSRGQILSYDVIPQVSDVFVRLMQLRIGSGLDEADGSLTAQHILAMCSRYNDSKLGRARLNDVAYFVLTMLEREFSELKSDKRRQVADKYGISRGALDRIAYLTSNAGGLEQARKASGIDKELSSDEALFLKQSIRRVILRAIEVVAEPDLELKQITLSELKTE